MIDLEVPFGEELVHYAVGPATCAVPGLPAGLDALWRAHGKLPWDRLVEPAVRIAREGAVLPPAHAACLAMLAPVFTMHEGAHMYAPGGRLLGAGGVVVQPGIARALEAVADEGAGAVYGGSIGEALLELSEERSGLITRDDLLAYRAEWREPVAVSYHGVRVLTRGGLSTVAQVLARLPRLCGADGRRAGPQLTDALTAPPTATATRAEWRDPVAVSYHGVRVLTRGGLSTVAQVLARLPRLAARTAAERVVQLTDALTGTADRDGHTTNTVTVDADVHIVGSRTCRSARTL